MSRGEWSAEREELLRTLDELLHLLRTHGEVTWADWLDRDRRLIADGHPDALGRLLAAYGGMGSFTDLTLHRVNGHDIADDKVRVVNDRLRTLRSAVHTQATALRAEDDSAR